VNRVLLSHFTLHLLGIKTLDHQRNMDIRAKSNAPNIMTLLMSTTTNGSRASYREWISVQHSVSVIR